jgi:hypothetical protein
MTIQSYKTTYQSSFGLAQIDRYLHTPAKVSRGARYAVKLSEHFVMVPQGVKGATKVAKVLKMARGPAFAYKLSKHLRQTVKTFRKNPSKGTILAVKTIRDVKKVAAAASFPCKLLHEAKILPDAAVSWIPWSHTLHPLMSLFSLALAYRGWRKAAGISNLCCAKASVLTRTEPKSRQIQLMKETLNQIQKEDPDSLRTSMKFPRSFDIAERVDRLQRQLLTPNKQHGALAESQEFLRTLADRGKLLYSLESLRVALKVTRIVGWTLSGILGYTSIGTGTLATASIASVATWLWQNYWMNSGL